MLYYAYMIDSTAYKTRLEAMLEDITNELASLGVHNPDVPEDWIATPRGTEVGDADPNVEADKAEDWNERRATLAELEVRYNNIRRALKKIEDGAFGVCEVSGEEIETDRLDANPAARTCKTHINDEATLPQ